MIKCIAIDDEPLALEQITSYIKRTPGLMLMQACQSAEQAREAAESGEIDAMFVDINMPDLNGLDFVKSLPEPPKVVFTTAYSEYAIDGFKVNAVDYLLKPFSYADFTAAVEKVQHLLAMEHAATAVSTVDADDSIFLKTDYKIVRIKVSEIRYIEAMSEYLRIHLDGRKSPLVVLLSMKRMEERLPGSWFMRVHRSYIINLKRIIEVRKSRIIIEGPGEGVEVPIGDLYKDALMAYINTKFLNK